jgi:membrane-bound inhibitor of C-type lysozyme
MHLTNKNRSKLFLSIAIAIGLSSIACAADITIHLPPAASVSRKIVSYQCDAQGPNIGVPSGPFPVEYINGGGNSLAIVPISGNTLIFSNVMSADGARYTAREFTWWEARGEVTLSSDSLTGKSQSTCKMVGTK